PADVRHPRPRRPAHPARHGRGRLRAHARPDARRAGRSARARPRAPALGRAGGARDCERRRHRHPLRRAAHLGLRPRAPRPPAAQTPRSHSMTAVAALPRARARALRIPRPELVGLLALAAMLDLWALSRNGWANDYYSAAVRSMASSWHAFLYGAFDQAG